ncbi:MAG: dihydrofolate reductase [Pyrinomonadaceae bacterium]
MIIGIVAISRNYAIGNDGKLPWHYPADLRFFKETTTGNAIVMGANTWLSIGRALPNRLNIVLTRSGNVDTPTDVRVIRSKAEVIELSKSLDHDVYIIGGAQTYAEFADVIDKWIVTLIPIDVEDADTFMPSDFLDGFDVKETKNIGSGLVIKILHRK